MCSLQATQTKNQLHLKTVSSLVFFPQSSPRTILSTSYDGVIMRWILGVGFGGRLMRKNNTQIKCFAAVEEELVTSGYDNKVRKINRLPILLIKALRVACLFSFCHP
jgi:hypothetical protein